MSLKKKKIAACALLPRLDRISQLIAMSENGDSDPQTGIYRDAEDGTCEVCIMQDGGWKEKVIDEAVVYN